MTNVCGCICIPGSYVIHTLSCKYSPLLYVLSIYQPFRKFNRISDRFVGAVGRDATGLYERVVVIEIWNHILNDACHMV